jgi:hypothetical protein
LAEKDSLGKNEKKYENLLFRPEKLIKAKLPDREICLTLKVSFPPIPYGT